MNEIEEKFKQLGIELNPKQITQFEKYINLLLEWNEKINLTAITDVSDIILKHFVDSATIIKYINKNSNVIDVGTGAGFPGIVLKILKPNIKLTLLDSLEKRIKFLKIVVDELELDDVELIHGRAEEYGKDEAYREKYDIATSRAVAKLSILDELLIPFVKVGGKIIVLKGANALIELKEAKNGIEILGGKVGNIDEFNLLDTENSRVNIEILKEKKTDTKYPRKFSQIKKENL